MSSDLFAAFGDPVSEPVQKRSQDTPEEDPWQFDGGEAQSWQAGIVSDAGKAAHVEDGEHTAEDDDDDDFGDFEDASAPTAPAVVNHTPPTESNPWSFDSQSISIYQPTTRSEPPQKPTPPKKSSLPFSPKPQVQEKPSKIGKHPFADHMDFLFSGGDDEYDAGEDELNDLATNPEAAMAYSKRIIAEQEARSNGVPSPTTYSKPTKPLPFKPKNEAVPAKKSIPQPQPPRPPNKLRKKSGYAPAKDPNVLFDAEDVSSQDEDDEDEFGEFEAGTADVPQPAAAPSTKPLASKAQVPGIDLLGLDDSFANDTAMDGMASPCQEGASSILRSPVDSRLSKLVNHTGPTATPAEDTWEDFETAEPTYPPPTTNPTTTPIASSPPPHPSQPPSKPLPKTPPTTIPPPSTLLSLLPSLLSTLQTTLPTPLSHLTSNPHSRQTLLSHPSTLLFLRTHLSHLLALAHILAGRKLRWKRDNILSQSHRLGAAGGKGMKLAGVDKSILIREDREVLDAVQTYRPIASKLRAAVASIVKDTPSATGLVVPELAEVMPVKSLSVQDGGLTGVRACALCGLKREERVAKCHDSGVEDSFGEWWVEGAEMHVCCATFWVEVAEGGLRGR
ncbi:unnamed protein product [Zymoseptoria tritici ST99CH_1E4]|uniref:Uncharacterized protein n=1 Tax=Zymoseptoria tritici ST99CH_1E4 TaxID=1276532 RepID=A0A2H1GEZ1_ZYMTR|nr:unnamed protein product [Zymoseptoria tritici ST99CH_1E4]